MDATPPGDLGTYLLGLLIGLVCWVFNRETTRTNKKVDEHDARINDHSQRLTALDGKTERD